MAVTKRATSGAWKLLRLALLWTRKGGAFRRGGAFVGLRLGDYIKSLKSGGRRAEQLHFGEREFSFEETPILRFKTPSARFLCFPCIAAPAADEDYFFNVHGQDRSATTGYWIDDGETSSDGEVAPEWRELDEQDVRGEEELEGIDSKAEQFIAKFYEQIKMQRQVSWIQYNDMLLRSVN
ncbi:uncharacterized protein LOC122004959 [Zingiber officinale]|uniref:Uncharacterized protein n=1 Tax=Zingiber officinale TaxID=94328 RepID=A0A8J5KFX7_ZINOF|nr:uncharacterized protein LOC122004959 [Zingiber officinale]KAG6488490.1 hypothetical protein ZIOFF_049733 [Zingiber officinale]